MLLCLAQRRIVCNSHHTKAIGDAFDRRLASSITCPNCIVHPVVEPVTPARLPPEEDLADTPDKLDYTPILDDAKSVENARCI